MHRLPYKYSNPYPTRKKCYIVVSKRESSNKDLKKLYLGEVLFPGAVLSYEGTYYHRVGILWDDFKAHSCLTVKESCKSHSFLDV